MKSKHKTLQFPFASNAEQTPEQIQSQRELTTSPPKKEEKIHRLKQTQVKVLQQEYKKKTQVLQKAQNFTQDQQKAHNFGSNAEQNQHQ